jgi:hypothetical protein
VGKRRFLEIIMTLVNFMSWNCKPESRYTRCVGDAVIITIQSSSESLARGNPNPMTHARKAITFAKDKSFWNRNHVVSWKKVNCHLRGRDNLCFISGIDLCFCERRLFPTRPHKTCLRLKYSCAIFKAIFSSKSNI